MIQTTPNLIRCRSCGKRPVTNRNVFLYMATKSDECTISWITLFCGHCSVVRWNDHRGYSVRPPS